MAGITTAMCTSFKKELMQALHDFTASTGNVFKIALFKAQASLTGTYDATTTNYSNMTGNSDELPAAGGYTTGGKSLTNVTPTTGGVVAFTTFSPNPSWTTSTFTTRGCMIYNSTNTNKAVAVFDFGGDQTVTSGTFTVQMPTADQTNAILRLA